MESLELKYGEPMKMEFDMSKGDVPPFAVFVRDDTISIIAGLEDGKPVALPDGFEVESKDGGKATRTLAGMFAVVWFDHYTVKYKGEILLELKPVRIHKVVLGEGFSEDRRIISKD